MNARAAAVAQRGIAIGAVAAAATIGVLAADDLLIGGLAWVGLLLAVLAGWGALVARAVGAEVDLGLRLAWGTVAALAIAGALLAVGRCDRAGLAAIAIGGGLGYAWREATRPVPTLAALAAGARRAVRDPATVGWLAIGALAAVQLVAAVVRTHGNVFDDDIAYTPFTRRLLQIGDLDEPFSLRRLSAYGGQTVLSGLGAMRGNLASTFLVDHGVFRLITLALVAGMLARAELRDRFVAGLTVTVLVLLPDAATNAASYWTGAALFLALYRTASQLDELPPRALIVLGATAGAVATLRQNYVPVAALFVGIVLVARQLRADARSGDSTRAGRAWLLATAGAALVLAPYLVAAWRSSSTVIYPLQLGTGSASIPTHPLAWTAWRELGFFASVVLDPNPVRMMIPLVPVALLIRDRRAGWPMGAMVIATLVGFAYLVHSFPLSDARNLWRYGFGYLTVLGLVLVVEASAARSSTEVEASPLARLVVVACLVLQLPFGLLSARGDLAHLGGDLADARARAWRDDDADARYRRMQAAIPAGATVAVMLDQPARLDYARNRILNLDTPGAASWRPGLPLFAGAAAKAGYLRAHGVRYVAFVRGDRSSFFYRRDEWLDRMLWDNRLWQVVAANQLDVQGDLETLARGDALRFEEAGLVVLEVPVVSAEGQDLTIVDESIRRAGFMAALAGREGLAARWQLMDRDDVQFVDGVDRSAIWQRDDAGTWRQRSGPRVEPGAIAARWAQRRVHLRVRGTGDARTLTVAGWIDRAAVRTRPRVALARDGHTLATIDVDDDGTFTITARVAVHGWDDIYLTFSSGDELRRDPARARLLRIDGVSWTSAP